MRGAAERYYYDEKEVVSVMTYEEWENVREVADVAAERRYKRSQQRKANYYRCQRCFALYIVLVGLLFILMGHIINEPTMMCVGVGISVIGVYTGFTKQMLLVNQYYMEMQSKKNKRTYQS